MLEQVFLKVIVMYKGMIWYLNSYVQAQNKQLECLYAFYSSEYLFVQVCLIGRLTKEIGLNILQEISYKLYAIDYLEILFSAHYLL